ncbi:rhomboid protease ROM8, putative [Plasmodium malariae]|uniref:Rhomboid-like protease n=1 Tax=Plasmodium malariae TaxID=5858 RepID=A0A1C3KFR9_PLAMA|nr:rhomboid protease ROM8, putative [Plasmodium malariae]
MEEKESGANAKAFLESKDKREKIDDDDDEDDKKKGSTGKINGNSSNNNYTNRNNDDSENVIKKNERKKNKNSLNNNDEKRNNDKNNKNKGEYTENSQEKKKGKKKKEAEQEEEEEEDDEEDDEDDEEEDDEDDRAYGYSEQEKERRKDELLNLNSNNTVKFYTSENDKSRVKNHSDNNLERGRYKYNYMKRGKKFKTSSTYEEMSSDHHEYMSLKVSYKINKKSHYDKSKKRSTLSMTMNDKHERTLNKSSICTDNAKFLNFLNDNEKGPYYYKNIKRYNFRRRKQKKAKIKKEKHDMKGTLDEYVVDIKEKNKDEDIFSSENITNAKNSIKHFLTDKKELRVSDLQDAEKRGKMKDEKRLKDYLSTSKLEGKFVKHLSKIKSTLCCNRRYFIFRKKTIRKRKEKIIIFLNNDCTVSNNGQFNDHFYRTIHKNDLDNLEEEKIYLYNNKENTLKKMIYRIFPQFSIFSLILYVTFIQWIVFILLISVKSDISLTPSNDSLKNFGSNFPHNIFKKAEFYRLYTALFLHSNFNHICANTYVQLTVGFLLEYLYGTYVVFLVYVFAGIYGIILSSPLTYCYSTTESSSSSAGIIGIFFSEILMMTNFNVDKISISVHLFCFFFLLLFLKFSLNTISINIYSHFFGFLGGFLIGVILKRNQLKYFLKNNLLIQILSLVFLITSLGAAIYISTYVVQKCPN